MAAEIDVRPPAAVAFRHSGWEATRRRIFDAFFRTAQPTNRKSQFQYCGSCAYILRNVEDPDVYRIAGSCCHDRFCLPCAKERSHAISLNVLEHLSKRRARFLTLTIKSTDEPLTDLLDKLYTGFQKLRQTKLWRASVTGGVAFLEINWSPERNRWHPHLHILIEGKYIPQPKLKALWYHITGDSYVVDIRLVLNADQAAKYITKYASKPFNNTFLTRPDRLDEAIVALKGRKLLLTFGTWRGVTLLHTPSDGAWQNVGSLQTYIENAAAGDKHARSVLNSLTTQPLEPIYARAPPLPPTGSAKPCTEKQLSWLGVWQSDGTWTNHEDP